MAEFTPPKGTKGNPATLGPFPKGMNNVQPRHSLPDGFAGNVVNADLTDSGIPRLRLGFTRKVTGTRITSSFENGDTPYFIDSGTLYKAAPDVNGALNVTAVPNTAGAVLTHGASFVDVAGTVVLGDSFSLFSIADTGLERFTHDAPGMNAISAAAGSKAFLVAVTGALPNSETQPSRTDRVIGDFPITVSLAAYDYPVNVYVSKPDGTTLYWRRQTSGTTVTVQSTDTAGRALLTEHLIPTPAGSIMRYAFGRLFSVVGKTVFYSLPYYPSVCSAVGGFLPFPHSITVFEPLDNGFVVATSKEIGMIFGKSPDAWEYMTLANYGAVQGSAHTHKDGTVFMYTPHGAVTVSKAGEFSNLHDGVVAVDLAANAASGVINDNGLERIVTSLANPDVSRMEATTFMEFEVIRKEVIV